LPSFLSMRSAQLLQRKIAFDMELRSCGDILESYLGPPAAAAEMWAAFPRYVNVSSSDSDGATVCPRQSGFEQSNAARIFSAFLTAAAKSSLAAILDLHCRRTDCA